MLSWDWRIGCLRSGGFSCGTGIGIDFDDDGDEVDASVDAEEDDIRGEEGVGKASWLRKLANRRTD